MIPTLVECDACGRLVNSSVNSRCPNLDCQEPLPTPLEVQK